MRDLILSMENQEPIALFKEWMDEARRAGTIDPTAMALATVNGYFCPTPRKGLIGSEGGWAKIASLILDPQFSSHTFTPAASRLYCNPVSSI